MISLLFARVINLIIVIVIVNNFCIVLFCPGCQTRDKTRTGVPGWETGTTAVSQPGQINVFVVVHPPSRSPPTSVSRSLLLLSLSRSSPPNRRPHRARSSLSAPEVISSLTAAGLHGEAVTGSHRRQGGAAAARPMRGRGSGSRWLPWSGSRRLTMRAQGGAPLVPMAVVGGRAPSTPSVSI